MTTPEILPDLVVQAQQAIRKRMPRMPQALALEVAFALHSAGMLRPRTNRSVRLTQQQRAVIICGARGETSEETASRLALGQSTIRCHRVAAYRRLGATGLGPAVTLALASGAIALEQILPADHPAFAPPIEGAPWR